MKTWNTPRVEVEKFEANEYVAVCYTLRCHESHPKGEEDNDLYYIIVGKDSNGQETYTIVNEAKETIGYNYYLLEDNLEPGFSEHDVFGWTTKDPKWLNETEHYGTVLTASKAAHPNRS